MSEEQDALDATIEGILQDCKRRLMEHCQSVAIFVTYENDDAQADSFVIGGNRFAVKGQVQDFLTSEREILKIMEWEDSQHFEEDDDEEGGEDKDPPA